MSGEAVVVMNSSELAAETASLALTRLHHCGSSQTSISALPNNDSSVHSLGHVALRSLRVHGCVQRLARDRVRPGHVLMERADVERADARSYDVRPSGARGRNVHAGPVHVADSEPVVTEADVVQRLPAIALSVKPGGSARSITIGIGDLLRADGEGIESIDIHGAIDRLEIRERARRCGDGLRLDLGSS